MQPWQRLRALLKEQERRRARNSLAVYAGLHIPAEIERDELAGQEKLPLAARYIPAQHHRLLIEKLEAVEAGKIKRLMVFMPPRCGKSTYCSTLFPAWYLGRHPRQHIIQGSYNDDLAKRFGRMARRAYSSKVHADVFGMGVSKDSSAAGNWETEAGGEYRAFGITAGITGRPANGAILDDLIAGRRDADSPTVRETVWDEYIGSVWTRLEKAKDTGLPGWIVYVATRWHEDDPAGRILPADAVGRSGWFTAKDGERWYVLSMAAVIQNEEDAENDPLRRKVGEIIWPEWFPADHFKQVERTQGARNWSALYQQKPRAEEGAILKREWWRPWVGAKPDCESVIQVYDTAFEEEEQGLKGTKRKAQPDYSARTTWGLFLHADTHGVERQCAILLEAWRGRVDFPTLRAEAASAAKTWQKDLWRILIEKKASGHSLVQELRRKGLPVTPIKVDQDKSARAYVAQIALEQGCVFYMATKDSRVDRRGVPVPRDDLEPVIDECERFPQVAHDDWTDTVVHALTWMRKFRKVELHGETEQERMRDEDEDPDDNAAPQGPRRLFG